MMEVLKILYQGRAFHHCQIKNETLCQGDISEKNAEVA